MDKKLQKVISRGNKIVFQIDDYIQLLGSRPQIKNQAGFDIRESDVSDRDFSILHNAYLGLLAADSVKHQKIRAIIVAAMEKEFQDGKPSGADALNLKILESQEKHLPLKARLQKLLQ